MISSIKRTRNSGGLLWISGVKKQFVWEKKILYQINDICFPAQIVIGEALAALESGKYDDKDVAIVMGKYVGDCRLTHYGALLRKALDDAGYDHIPILTNDDARFS